MQLDAACNKEEHLDESLVRVEAKGAAGNHPQQVVEALHDPIRVSLVDVGKDPLLMFTDCPSGLDEWLARRTSFDPL